MLKSLQKSLLHLPHLLSIQTLDKQKINRLLDRADALKLTVQKQEILPTLRGKVVANLFLEPSTRTRNSFEIAEQRLGAIVLSPDMKQSSANKGELLIDTIRNLEAMGVAAFVIRHPDNHLAQFLSTELSTATPIINAGDGSNEHPTQTLLDLMTIRQHYPDFSTVSVAIVGDVIHSRVARSLITGLQMMGTQDIRLVAPDYFSPPADAFSGVTLYTELEAGLNNVDVIYLLRIQKERIPVHQHPKEGQYFELYGLTNDRLLTAKSNAIVMHPGPMNRGVEIESAVADGPQSVILQQTQNSVALRMAVLEAVITDQR